MATTEQDIPGYPLFLQEDAQSTTPIYYSAKDFRTYTKALQFTPGILTTGSFRVTQADNIGFAVRITAGWANIGDYITSLANHTELTLDWTTPPTGTRTHRIYAAIYDELIAGLTNKAKLIAIEDTGTGAGTPPGAAAYLELATIKIAAGQPNIQNKDITNTAPHGGNQSNPTDLTPYLTAGISPAPATPGPSGPRAITTAGAVRLSGRIQKTNGSTFATNTEIPLGTTHPNMRPKYTQYPTGTCALSTTGTAGGTMTYRLTINPDGTLTARIPTYQDTKYLLFDGITYDLD